MSMDVTMKGQGRMQMTELCVYLVKDGKIAAVGANVEAPAGVTVVDCSFNVEDDEELSFDTAAPRRNGATLAVLEAADTVLCVSGRLSFELVQKAAVAGAPAASR